MPDTGSPGRAGEHSWGGGEPAAVQIAQAGTGDGHAEPIGVIRAISGQVGLIQVSSTTGDIGVGSPVYLNDTVTTGHGGAIEIVFVDGTSFSLGADASVQIDKLIYNPDGGGNSLDISVATGAFAFIAGSIAEKPGEGMSIETPAGTIGIRGTAGAGTPDPAGGYVITVLNGHIVVSTPLGSVLLDQPLETTHLSSRLAPPSEPTQITPQDAEDIFGTALQLLRGRQQDLHEKPEEEFAQLGNINPAAGEGADAPVEFAEKLPVQLQLADIYGLLRILAEMGALPPGALENSTLNFPEFSDDALGTPGFQALAFANAPPMAADDAANPNDSGSLAGLSTGEDTSLTIPAERLLANDSDADGDTLTITSVSDPPHGTAVLNSDGSITYTPDPNYNGTDSFTYTVSDGHGGTATAKVTVEVDAINDPPVAGNDSPAPGGTPGTGLTTNEDNALTIAPATLLTNDSDADGDSLTITAVGTPAHGTAVLNDDGSITYTPDPNYNGTDSFTYTISDGHGGTATATATVNVQSVNDLPVAGNDSAATDEDTPVTIPVLGNDSDADGDALTVTQAGAENGTVQINQDGTLTYTPNQNFNGTDTITYTVADSHGGTATATATVTVSAVNDPPVAGNDSATTDEDTPVTIPVLANDSDVDGDALTVTQASAGNGTVQINQDGTLTYTPNENFNGSDTITYTVSDGNGGTATATVAVTVSSVNDPPVAGNDTASTNEDTPVTFAVLGNDSDADGDALTVTQANAGNGSVQINQDGSLTYTPNENFNGTDTVTYTISDGNGGTATATVAVTVNAVNDPPVAVNDTASTSEDTPVTIPVLTNDSDVDGDPLTVTQASAGNGTVQINQDGTLTYTPNENFNGSDTVTYTVSDGNGGTSTATVAVTVSSVNDPPVAVDDSASTNEDTPVTFAVLGNDSDADGDALTVTQASAGNGSVQINQDGSLTYTPNENFNGTDTVTYTISDGKGGTDTGTATVTVAAVNDPPVAVEDSASTNEDTPVIIDVLDNDTDVDGDSLTVTNATAEHGTVTFNDDGTLTYTPDKNFNGTDTITYTVSDGHDGTDIGTATVTVGAVNDPPVAGDDKASTNEDTPVTFTVLTNDSDPDGDDLAVTKATAEHGSVKINDDGTLTYTPDENFNGTDPITYTVSDGHDGTDTGAVTVTVSPVNDPPVAVEDSASTNEDTPVIIDVLDNDTDVDGDSLTVTQVAAEHGTVKVNDDGTLTYTPDKDFNGTDTITYTVSDGHDGTDTGTATVTVGAVNDPPIAGDDKASTNEDTPVTFTVLANDSDPDGDDLAVTKATAEHGSVKINDDGTLTYTPDENFNGTDTITYTVSDGHDGTDTGAVTVTVSPVNDPPVAVEDSASTNEDTPVIIDVLDNDTDVDGDSLTVTQVTAEHGTVKVNDDGTLTYTPDKDFNGTDTITYTVSDGHDGTDTGTATVTVGAVNDPPVAGDDKASTNEDTPVIIAVLSNDTDADGDDLTVTKASAEHGTVKINDDGTLTYTPNANFNGTDTITYTVSDGHDGTDTGAVAVTVAAVNDPPVAVDDSASTNEDTPVVIDVLDNDTDVEGDSLTVTQVTAEHGTVKVNDDGTLTYTPDKDFNGTDTITYTVSDGHDGTDTGTATVTVGAVNDPPVAVDDKASTNEDTPVIIAVLSNDTDTDGDDLAVTKATAEHGTVKINDDGTLTYTPDENFNGTDTITYTVSDGHDGTDTGAVAVTVAAVNDPPVAVDDSASTNEDTPVIIDVLDNDTDVEGDSLTVTQVTAEHGTVKINDDGTLTYTPDKDFNGTDTITYTVSDGHDGTDTGKATVTVGAVNDPPVAVDDKASTNEDTAVIIAVLSNDTDADGDDLAVTKASAEHGTVKINDDGTLTYTPNANFNGTDTITYTVSDGHDGTDTGVATVTVAAVNDPPVAGDDKVATREDTALTIAAGTLLANDSDVDGDQLTITGVSDPTHGTAVVNDDGSVTYTPDADYKGPDSFTYTVSDGKGGTDTATVAVTVEDSTPKPGHETATVFESGLAAGSSPADNTETATGTLTLGDPDSPLVTEITFGDKSYTDAGDGSVDGVITVTSTAGLLKVNAATGDYTYTLTSATQGDSAQESFTYKVTDKFGNSANGSLTVGITDDRPTANADTFSTADTINQTVNLVIVLDISGSMNDNPGVAGFSTRLALAKAALADLFAAYEGTADINVLIVPFSSQSTTSSGWLSTGAEANAYLNTLSAGGGTNYAAGIQRTMNVFDTGLPHADKTQVYFLSDGAPTNGQSLRATGLVDDWERFVADKHIQDVFAVGIGSGIPANDQDLADVALPNGPANNPEPNLITVLDESRLTDTLVGTVPNTVSGSILANDVFGADGRGNGGGGLSSITVDGVTYSYNHETNQITNDNGLPTQGGSTLTVTTALEGTLKLDFATGTFEYVPPDIDGSASEKFTYTIVDGDGDVSSASFTVDITDAHGGGATLRTMSVTADSGAGPAGDSSALVADNSAQGEIGQHRLQGGRLHGSALNARDIFAGDHDLDLSKLGHHGSESPSHAPAAHDFHAPVERHALDVALPAAVVASPTDGEIHHTAG